jgi:hypothetical protein
MMPSLEKSQISPAKAGDVDGKNEDSANKRLEDGDGLIDSHRDDVFITHVDKIDDAKINCLK